MPSNSEVQQSRLYQLSGVRCGKVSCRLQVPCTGDLLSAARSLSTHHSLLVIGKSLVILSTTVRRSQHWCRGRHNRIDKYSRT